jgi:hypothetical protein
MTPHTLQGTAGGKIADAGALQSVVDSGNELSEGEGASKLTLAAVRTGCGDVMDQPFIAPARSGGRRDGQAQEGEAQKNEDAIHEADF